MMSTAMVVSVGTELGTMRSGNSEREGGEGMTFAESFGKSAGLSIDGQGKGTVGASVRELSGWKNDGLSKDSEKAGLIPDGTRAKMIAGQGGQESEVSKGGAVKASVPKNPVAAPVITAGRVSSGEGEDRLPSSGDLQEPVVKDAQAAIPQKARVVSPAMPEEVLQPDEKQAQEASLSAPKLPADMGLKDLKSMPHDEGAALDHSLEVESAGRKKNVSEKKSQDVASAKKTEKTNGAGGLKTMGGIQDTKATVAQSVDGLNMPAVAAMPGKVLLVGNGQQDEIGKAANPGSDEVLAKTGKTVGGADGSRSKEVAPGSKFAVADGGDATNTVTSQSSPAKPEADSGTPVVAGASGEKDGDGKSTSPVDVATVAHAGAGSNGTVSEIAPGIAIGHTPAEVAGGKVQAGEVVAHTASSQAGLGEQGGATGAAESGGAHRILTATSTSLEVGVANGTQGWLKIRAEMSEGGQVNASLSSATSAGQEMLHRELPALAAYLHQERVAVNAVVVHTPVAPGTAFQPAGGRDAEQGGQMQQHDPQRGGEEGRQGLANITLNRAGDAMTHEGLDGISEDGLLSSGTFAGGSYLNVRA